MAAGDVYTVRARFMHAPLGKRISFGFHILMTSPLTGDPSLSAIGDDVIEWWDTGSGGFGEQKQYHAEAIELQEVTLRKVQPMDPLIQTYSAGLPIAGTASGDSDPLQTGPIVSIRCVLSGRNFRNRAYLPPVAEEVALGNDVISSGDAQSMADSFWQLRDQLTAEGVSLTVWSPTEGFNNVANRVMVDERLRTQRRRQIRSSLFHTAS